MSFTNSFVVDDQKWNCWVRWISAFNFFEECPCFFKRLYQLTFPSTVNQGCFTYPTSMPTLAISVLCDECQCHWSEMLSRCCSDLHFSDVKWCIAILSYTLWPLRKFLHHPPLHFLMSLVFILKSYQYFISLLY